MAALPKIEPGQVKQIALALIKPDPKQARQTFNLPELKELAADIKKRGIEQPITIYKNGSAFIIKHGERRWRAAKLAKLKTVPVILVEEGKTTQAERERLFDQYAENMLRADLNAIDLARMLKRLTDDFKHPVKDLPAILKKHGVEMSRPHISNTLRLLELPEWAQDLIAAGDLSAFTGRQLLVAVQSKNVIEALRPRIEKAVKRNAKTAEKLDNAEEGDEEDSDDALGDLNSEIIQEFRKQHIDLGRTDSYYDKERVFYDYKKLSDADRKKLHVVEIGRGYYGHAFALNPGFHKQLNEAGRKAHEEKEKKQAAKETAAKKKGKKKGKVSGETGPSMHKLGDYFHAWLRGWFNLHAAKVPEEAKQALLLWAGYSCPDGDPSDKDDDGTEFVPGDRIQNYFPNDSLGVREQAWVAAAQRKAMHLPHFLAIKDDRLAAQMVNDIAGAALRGMTISNLVLFAKHLKLKLTDIYAIDQAYVDLHRKDSLNALFREAADEAGAHDEVVKEFLACKKLGDMKACVLKHKEIVGVPEELLAIWENPNKVLYGG